MAREINVSAGTAGLSMVILGLVCRVIFLVIRPKDMFAVGVLSQMTLPQMLLLLAGIVLFLIGALVGLWGLIKKDGMKQGSAALIVGVLALVLALTGIL